MDTTLLIQSAAGLRRSVRYIQPGAGTLQAAVTKAPAGATLVLAPGTYTGNVTIPRTLSSLTLVGAGGRGSVGVEAATNGVALTNHADDVTLVNVGLAGAGTGGGLLSDGARLRMSGCKIEGGTDACILAVGTVAQRAALTHGGGADVLLEDCEVCWSTNGIVLRGSDYGAVTQPRVRHSRFHNLSASSIVSRIGSGGSAAVGWRNLEVDDCVFAPAEDGTPPTKYLSLNANNANTGVVSRCVFPTALAGGLNLVSTLCLWVANSHTGGVSGAQPS